MRYFMSRIEETIRDREYRYYVTDALKVLIPGGKDVPRYADLFVKQTIETRTPEEIKENILSKLRGEQDGPIHTSGKTDAG